MKRELRDKDLLIQNLKDRLATLEKEFQVRILDPGKQCAKPTEDEVVQKKVYKAVDKEESRDKSQQRIKEAIINLEKKLEQYSKEREENNRLLEEFRLYGSQHTSSRQSQAPPNFPS